MDRPSLIQTHLKPYLNLPHPLHILDTSTDPWAIMCGIMLSASTTDAAVNRALPGFLARYPTPQSAIGATKDAMIALLPAIAHTGNKCGYILAWAEYLVQHNGVYPTDINVLTELPGIGRKTGGIFLWVTNKKDDTFPLDIHCLRVVERLGWYTSKNPKSLEKEMLKEFPCGTRNLAHRMLTQFGRNLCTNKKPQCTTCPLKLHCQYGQANP